MGRNGESNHGMRWVLAGKTPTSFSNEERKRALGRERKERIPHLFRRALLHCEGNTQGGNHGLKQKGHQGEGSVVKSMYSFLQEDSGSVYSPQLDGA